MITQIDYDYAEGLIMINEQYKYSELTEKIIGCAMEVHRQIGNGYQEVIYQRALEIEMKLQGLAFSREHEMEIFYKGENIGTRRVDYLVESVVPVELKALIQIVEKTCPMIFDSYFS